MLRRLWFWGLALAIGAGVAGVILVAFTAALIQPNLPSLEALTDYQPKVPLRVYTSDGALIGEFGEERRALVKIDAVPRAMIQAILAAEDDRFYQHGGIDYLGVLRAAVANVLHRGAQQGASTITMQVARNFFLSREKTLTRKLSEAMLALKIEHSLSKDQILELYINQIYLGQRAYGFAAAAQIYFAKPLEQISIAEAAMLAGLPKAPSRFNPVVNPKRAQDRQHYILRRMLSLGFINQAEHDAAREQKLDVKRSTVAFDVKADHLAEMVRQIMYERFQEDVYTKGFRVYTTLRREDQLAASAALRQGVLDYDRRHGYRGPEKFVELPPVNGLEEALAGALDDLDEVNGLEPAVVVEASPTLVKAWLRDGSIAEVRGDGLKLGARALGDKADARQRIRRGAVIRVTRDDKRHWLLAQLPQIEAALISVAPDSGAIRALAGGFDFNTNKFNRVVQAWRQPGSSFKPFIYSAALEKGFSPASIVNDAPIVVDPAETGNQVWSPKNFDGEFAGPIRVRNALMKSKNLVSIRLLQAIGPHYAQDYVSRFGFDAERHPPYLTMALGAGAVTPLQMATGYAVFANGGYRVQPYYIERILDVRGEVLGEARPKRAGEDAERVIDPRNAFLMTSMMQDVVRGGTATRALQLKRGDLAGKTGTTNDQVDAWFCGYNASLVAVAWIGFDQPRNMGGQETGGFAALPIWMGYMATALKGVPDGVLVAPEGVASARINDRGAAGSGIEYFYQENPPPAEMETPAGIDKSADDIRNQLF